jgi:hypothetical protein
MLPQREAGVGIVLDDLVSLPSSRARADSRAPALSATLPRLPLCRRRPKLQVARPAAPLIAQSASRRWRLQRRKKRIRFRQFHQRGRRHAGPPPDIVGRGERIVGARGHDASATSAVESPFTTRMPRRTA